MNIAFFLTPKDQVAWVPATSTVSEALERMDAARHGAVPLLDADGRYVGTVTEGDLLWHLLKSEGPWRDAAGATKVLAVERRMRNHAVHIEAEMEALLQRIVDQNFVPVVDDREVFVGIVRRQHVVEFWVQRSTMLQAVKP